MAWKQSLILSENLQNKMQVWPYFFFFLLADLPYACFRCLSDRTQMWVSGGEEKIMFLNSEDKKT